MTHQQPGLLRTSLRFTWQGLNDIPLLRASVLWPVLGITLLCLGLAAFGVTQQVANPERAEAFSPRLFAFLFLPAEFLLYDLIQGNPDPRLTMKRLWLDWRFGRLAWTWIQAALAVGLPGALLMTVLVAVTTGFSGGAKPTPGQATLLIAALVAVACAMMYCFFRLLYLSLAVARRDPHPLRAAFGETRGRVWSISGMLFLPYAAIMAAGLAVELLGPELENRLGLLGLAPWFLLDACVTGFLCCLSAAVLAFSHQRLFPGPIAAQPQTQEPSPAQADHRADHRADR